MPGEHSSGVGEVSETDGSGTAEEQEKGVVEECVVPQSDFPDGGLKAWLVVFGVRSFYRRRSQCSQLLLLRQRVIVLQRELLFLRAPELLIHLRAKSALDM